MHPDEGTIHAWLDGELTGDTRAEFEAHIATCAECSAAVAEARGLVAASSRILSALDNVPGGVIPESSTSPRSDVVQVAPISSGPRKNVADRMRRIPWRAAAAVMLVAGLAGVVARRGTVKAPDSVAQMRADTTMLAASSVTPSASLPPAITAPTAAPSPASGSAPSDERRRAIRGPSIPAVAEAAPRELREPLAPAPPQSADRDIATQQLAVSSVRQDSLLRAERGVVGAGAGARMEGAATRNLADMKAADAAAPIAAAMSVPRDLSGCWAIAQTNANATSAFAGRSTETVVRLQESSIQVAAAPAPAAAVTRSQRLSKSSAAAGAATSAPAAAPSADMAKASPARAATFSWIARDSVLLVTPDGRSARMFARDSTLIGADRIARRVACP